MATILVRLALGGPVETGPLAAALALGPCKDRSSGNPVRLLQPDERTSCKEELTCEDDGYYCRSCQRHRDMYEASKARRACAVGGCNNAARQTSKGVKTSLGPADLRIYAHDLRFWGHDKDYGCLAAFPCSFFSSHRLIFVRIDVRGRVTLEEVRGADTLLDSPPIWLVIHQGHMRFLLPPTAQPLPVHCHPADPARRTGRGSSILGLRPLFRQTGRTVNSLPLRVGGPPPSVWCYGAGARIYVRALSLLAITAVWFEGACWPDCQGPAHVWVDFRGDPGFPRGALRSLRESACALFVHCAWSSGCMGLGSTLTFDPVPPADRSGQCLLCGSSCLYFAFRPQFHLSSTPRCTGFGPPFCFLDSGSLEDGAGSPAVQGGGEEPGPAVTARPPTVNHSVNHSKRDRGATHKYLVGVREEWATTFTRPMVSALTLRELLALPGYKGKVVWASGDATLDCVAAIDWTSRQAFSLPVDVFRDPLRQFVFGASQGEAEASSFEPSPPEEFIVSVTELLAVVALAAARGPEWRGRLVAYAGDNQTVGVWLEKRHTHREGRGAGLRTTAFRPPGGRAGTPMARQLDPPTPTLLNLTVLEWEPAMARYSLAFAARGAAVFLGGEDVRSTAPVPLWDGRRGVDIVVCSLVPNRVDPVALARGAFRAPATGIWVDALSRGRHATVQWTNPTRPSLVAEFKPPLAWSCPASERQLLWDPEWPLPALHANSWLKQDEAPRRDSLWLLQAVPNGPGARCILAQEAFFAASDLSWEEAGPRALQLALQNGGPGRRARVGRSSRTGTRPVPGGPTSSAARFAPGPTEGHVEHPTTEG
ncbi:unnamed protein product [Symbiodinium natans]|uniref:Uncharacterized protein n=1 Tax=Symbiodinium natans TaxID=878477 RepID=A0A812MFJ7_9DINO|nr:unnamed protein product [Symbiodinium natans]